MASIIFLNKQAKFDYTHTRETVNLYAVGVL